MLFSSVQLYRDTDDGSSQQGATMVEFALTIGIFLILLAFAVEGGIALWRYSLLTDGLNLITVDRAIHLEQKRGLGENAGACNDCSALQPCLSLIHI